VTVLWVVETAAPGSRHWTPHLFSGAPTVRVDELEANSVAARLTERYPNWRYRVTEYQEAS
jgi:hypothetical protein